MKRLWVLDLVDRRGALSSDKWPGAAHLVVDPVECPPDGAWPAEIVTDCGMRLARWSSAGHGFYGLEDGELPLAPWAIHCGLGGPAQ